MNRHTDYRFPRGLHVMGEVGPRADTLVLKPNMVLPGDDSGEVAAPERVAAETVAALRDVVPEDLACVAFLSGGQDGISHPPDR